MCPMWRRPPRHRRAGHGHASPSNSAQRTCASRLLFFPVLTVGAHEAEPQRQDVGPSACSTCCHMLSVQQADGMEETSGERTMFSFPSSLIRNVTYTYCGLPWWLSDKESACSAGGRGSIPGSGRSPGSSLAWRSPWREEPGRLQPTGWPRVGHD